MTERTSLGSASFADQACELVETGQFELSVVAVQLHFALHVHDEGPAVVTDAITSAGGERLGQRLAAHLERWNAVTVRGEAVTKDAAVESIEAVTEACAALDRAVRQPRSTNTVSGSGGRSPSRSGGVTKTE